MKPYIQIGEQSYNQEAVIRNNLSLQHLLLLEHLTYLYTTSRYCRSRRVEVVVGDKVITRREIFITLPKILADLEILHIKERRLRQLINELIEKKFIQISIEHSSRGTWLFVDFSFITDNLSY